MCVASAVEYISINGLFGNRNVKVNLSEGRRILIGENGLGKTTILGIANELLNGKPENLLSYPFRSVEIKFSNLSWPFHFTIESIRSYIDSKRYVCEDMDEDGVDMFIHEWLKRPVSDDVHEAVRRILQENPKIEDRLMAINISPVPLLADLLEKFSTFFAYKAQIRNLSYEVVFLPTYRRIEVDIKNVFPSVARKRDWRTSKSRLVDDLIFDDEYQEFVNTLTLKGLPVRFGMNDISDKINNILDNISRRTVRGYGEVSGKIISRLLDAKVEGDSSIMVDPEQVKIVVDRLGDNIPKEERERLERALQRDNLQENPNLAYYLSSLADVYKKTERYDTAIKSFIKACNDFLFDKEFRYDESHVRIGLYFRSDRSNAREISLNKLSSGEKQIIALMAAAYLSIGKKLVFIMDEPELSLSLIWQRRLLPALVDSGNCSLLLVATHSPFVFDNDMRRFTSGTDEYVKFSKG